MNKERARKLVRYAAPLVISASAIGYPIVTAKSTSHTDILQTSLQSASIDCTDPKDALPSFTFVQAPLEGSHVVFLGRSIVKINVRKREILVVKSPSDVATVHNKQDEVEVFDQGADYSVKVYKKQMLTVAATCAKSVSA